MRVNIMSNVRRRITPVIRFSFFCFLPTNLDLMHIHSWYDFVTNMLTIMSIITCRNISGIATDNNATFETLKFPVFVNFHVQASSIYIILKDIWKKKLNPEGIKKINGIQYLICLHIHLDYMPMVKYLIIIDVICPLAF